MAYTPGSEVAVFPHGSQFEGGESAYLCVFFGCADIAACSHPGTPVGQSWEWVDQTADRLANEVQGAGSYKTSQGASLQAEYDALQSLHLTNAPITVGTPPDNKTTINNVKKAIASGAVVLLCGEESGFVDVASGTVDYTWTPTGNHCIVVSGYSADGNLLVRDYAATRSGVVPGSLRTYLSDKVVPVSATAVFPYWHNPSENTPGKDWHDDGTTLTCPNGHTFVKGFREYVLSHDWKDDDQALENEHGNQSPILHNKQIGNGTSQCTKYHYLWWTQSSGVVDEHQLGSEVFALQQKLLEQPQVEKSVPQQPASHLTLPDLEQALQETAKASGQPVALLLSRLFSDLMDTNPQSPSTAQSGSQHAEPPAQDPGPPPLPGPH